MAESSRIDASRLENRSLDQVPHAPKRTEPVGFLLRLAKALHAYGLPAYELEYTMNGCAEALGYGIQCMSLPTSVSMTLLPPDETPQTYLIRVSPGDVNLEKLRRTTLVAEKVISGEMSCQDGAAALKQIAQSARQFPAWIEVIAFALVSTCIARLFSGSLVEMLAAGAIGLSVGLLAMTSRHHLLLDHLLPSVCAFVATVLAFFIDFWLPQPIAVSVVIISGLIILLPGLTLTIAMAELATHNLVSGTARMAGATTVFIQLGFGSALGVELGRFLGFDLSPVAMAPVSQWSVWLAAAVGAMALVPLFEATRRDLHWFLLASLTAFGSVKLATPLFGASLGAFCGAITIGVLAKLMTRFFAIPGAMIMMPGFIILVPGSVGYRSILALVDKDIVGGLQIAFDVAVIGISLVAGFLISSMVTLPRDRSRDHY